MATLIDLLPYLSTLLAELELPPDILDRCIECVKIIDRANVGRTLRDKEEYARIVVFLVSQERGITPSLAFRGKITLKRLDLVSKLLHDTLYTVPSKKASFFLASCKAAIEKIVPWSDEVDRQAKSVIDRLSPLLSSKSTVVGIAVITYVILQSRAPFLNFKAKCRRLGVSPSSLRAALRSIARSIGIAWRGASTRFDAALVGADGKWDGGRDDHPMVF